ncbi:hypothetical protein SDJN02_13248, partial [Cucurbita argyrosperma subsp. argyrosperma]
MSAAFSACFRPSSANRRHSPPPDSGFPNLTTCIYHTNFALFTLSWSQSLFSHSLLLNFHRNLNPFDSPPNPSSSSSSSSSISFRLLIRALNPWKKHGCEKLSDSIHVFWDLRRARFSSSPEPYSGFFIAVVVEGEMTLLVGDMIKEASAKTRAAKSEIPQTLILKREHVIANKIYTTKAKFGGQIREIEIDCGLFEGNDDELGLSFSVDRKMVLEIKRLKWKFRGNERIEVEGIPVDVYWDVYSWIFESEKENRGNAVFMFRFEAEEQSNPAARQQNLNLGLKELEWRRMRSSLSSSSVSVSASTSSVGSSAGASSSVMEWANGEDSDVIGAPSGFCLLIYAWRR